MQLYTNKSSQQDREEIQAKQCCASARREQNIYNDNIRYEAEFNVRQCVEFLTDRFGERQGGRREERERDRTENK